MSSLAQRAMQNPVLAAVYERAWRPVLGFSLMGFDPAHVRQEKQRTVEALGLAPGDRVLDVACGPGLFTRVFAEAVVPGGLAVGVDLSAPMLAQGARRGSDGGDGVPAYVRGSAHALPFADGAFDAVGCYAALYLIPDPFRALAEITRVLRPGGRLALMASIESPHRPVRAAQHLTLPRTGLRMFGADELTGWLREAGYRDVVRERHGVAQYVAATRG
ncbi:MAG: methyltransferase domain-containing protein [Nocardioides sp.]|nr:methyltransferase domain-containing protein [Nocardioides sp.]